LKSHPEFSQYGAYSPDKVYTPEQITEIVRFAKARGVRVIPEFDLPAHVGEGFQKLDLLSCFNAQPWQDYCAEPPCSQFDPSKDQLYDVLEDIYREMLEYFEYPDMFHMGGDEVSFSCWNSSESLKSWMTDKGWDHNEDGFMKVWNFFQENALARLDKVNHHKVPIIIWTSRKLTCQHIHKLIFQTFQI
jgi:hexosaminidase